MDLKVAEIVLGTRAYNHTGLDRLNKSGIKFSISFEKKMKDKVEFYNKEGVLVKAARVSPRGYRFLDLNKYKQIGFPTLHK